MLSGPLSITEKYAIQGMLHEHKSLSDIAKILGRTEKTVEKYINNDLENLIDTIIAAKIQASEAVNETVDETSQESVVVKAAKVVISKELYDSALKFMLSNGFPVDTGKELLDNAIQEIQYQPNDGRELYMYAITNKPKSDLMIHKTGGGNVGVSIMTEQASTAGDSSEKPNKQKTISRMARGNVFKVKEGKMVQ